ncbi:MAG: XdhC family protein [Oscillospiraceae bacterium]|jgi:xanthine dehydrogenase accessory factor|nr:XdhC family protein [Oscillospiraceae bacterium]
MKKLIPIIYGILSRAERAALALVVDSNGSTPRKAGSLMAMTAEGGSYGTVGGGALEFEAQRVLREMLEQGNPHSKTEGYSLSSSETGDLCMICGGDVYMHYLVVEPTDANVETFRRASAAARGEEDSWLAFRIAEGAPTEIMLLAGGDKFGEYAGLLRRIPEYDDRDTGVFAMPITQSGRVYIFGGGHVAQALVPVLASVDFSCVVYEDREDFASPELFNGARGTVCASFAEINENVKITEADCVVILTRGHKNDFEVLTQTLASPAYYVGCIGSSRKIAVIRQRLTDEAGIPAQTVARLHSPIGLDIEAETPAEIAVSIAAEMIRFRATGE